MILSNRGILDGIKQKRFSIGNLTGDEDPSLPPFNTSAVDLTLNDKISIPTTTTAAVDLRKGGGIADFLSKHSESCTITKDQPYSLEPNKFILAQTLERVNFPIHNSGQCYSARIEGKSSIARCGILVHFTAPTIHAGFRGPITLEITNLGVYSFLLSPKMAICQLIIEEVTGALIGAQNQFIDQVSPTGTRQN